MTRDWQTLHFDLMALKQALETFRTEGAELGSLEAENLLAAARECNVELIALRSALEQARLRKARKGSQP